MSGPAHAAKVILIKPVTTAPGEPLAHEPIPPDVLATLHVTVLADYPAMVLGEVPDAETSGFQLRAEDAGVAARVRPDFDSVIVNGYELRPGGEPALPPDLRLAAYPGGDGLYLVQLEGPPTPEWMSALTKAGEFIYYYPQNTYLLRIPADKATALTTASGVQQVRLYQPAYKVAHQVLDAVGPLDVVVQLDGGRNLANISAMIEGLTAQTPVFEETGPIRNAMVRVNPGEARSLALQPEVLWIEAYVGIEPSGERQAMITAGEHNGTRPDPVTHGVNGYHDWLLSKGFCTPTSRPPGCIDYWTSTVVFDIGLDTHRCVADGTGCRGSNAVQEYHHQDLSHYSHGQPVEYRFFCYEEENGGGWTNVCQASDSSYVYTDYATVPGRAFRHGTAVSSIIAGDILEGNPLPEVDEDAYYKVSGSAPLARIVTGSYVKQQVPGYPYPGYANVTPGGYEHFQQKLFNAAMYHRFVNNSWNQNQFVSGGYALQYTTMSQKMDELVRDGNGGFNDVNHALSLVFSAGNQDPSLNPNGYTIAPANAKNVISVGNAHVWRRNLAPGSGGTACCAQATCGHSIDEIRWDSCRSSPVDGGSRFKPDLVAPSEDSAAAAFADAQSDHRYTCFGGTSGAAPVVTGSTVLLEAWYYHKYGTIPSPALLKAMLVARADDLYGGTDNMTGWTLPHSPSSPQGWGRVDLDGVIDDSVETVIFDEDHTTAGERRFKWNQSGGYWDVSLQKANPNRDVIVVLAYTDRYAAPNASALAVNDLNLAVWNGGSYAYCGNHFAAGSYYTDIQWPGCSWPDSVNNVEVIRIPHTATGPLNVEVTAVGLNGKAVPLNEPGPNQDFALYAYNARIAP